MRIGVPTEIKDQEGRVGLTPAAVRELTARGHEVFVQAGAGARCQCEDEDYDELGAEILDGAPEVFASAELIVKVKEPLAREVELLQPGQVLFTYLHLAAAPELARDLAASGATCIAYETVEASDGSLPLLAPMSEIAGRLAAQVAAACLMAPAGGLGRLIGGVPGVAPARVAVLGGGAAGTHAAEVAAGMGADVAVLELSPLRLRALGRELSGRVSTHFSTASAIEELITEADVVIGTVLSKAARAPKLLRRRHLAMMRPGGIVVDVSIDQGGCFETSMPTTHTDPTYVLDGILHYCVTNMPGAVPVTSTHALTNATLPYVLSLAELGVEHALAQDPGLRAGLNIADGEIVHPVVKRELETVLTEAPA
jgi:alanine dehydrogenase